MKVLFIAGYYTSNTYLNEIVDPLKKYCEVVCSSESFWVSNLHFDIIHFQWPEALLFSLPESLKKDFFDKLQSRINYWKQRGTKLVATRHNEVSHYNLKEAAKLYEIIYSQSDAVIHLGENSKEKLAYNNINTVIEHPNYNTIVDQNVSKEQARKHLNIDPQEIVFFSFGKIRKQEEESNLIKGFLGLSLSNKKLIICNSLFSRKKPSMRQQPVKRIKYILKEKKFIKNRISFGKQNISDQELNQYIVASDVIISPRVDTLNSGVIYLAYSYGKPVIGPNIGNIKENLQKLNNPMFQPNEIISYANAMEKAFLNANELGRNNKIYSDKNLDGEIIAKQHFDLYKTLSTNE